MFIMIQILNPKVGVAQDIKMGTNQQHRKIVTAYLHHRFLLNKHNTLHYYSHSNYGISPFVQISCVGSVRELFIVNAITSLSSLYCLFLWLPPPARASERNWFNSI